ncbi:VanW family protein [Patescibacteria group bacterium]|nr:VanW family protein [Patescibacteria group bacterium]MBU1123255.1 VanW family protein [Patescibacteria group bacterium]MBU1910972.1 VanW family protein [Patescibacteria group bacterium]
MKQTTKNLSQLTALLLGVLYLVTIAPSNNSNFAFIPLFTANIGSDMMAAAERYAAYPDMMEYRIAKRLKQRLRKTNKSSPNIHVLADAILRRQGLMRRSVNVELFSSDGAVKENWNASLQAYPTWINPKFTYSTAEFSVSEEIIQSYLEEHYFPGITPPTDVNYLGDTMSGTILRAKTDGIAMAGYETNVEDAARQISEALEYGYPDLTFSFDWREGQIYYESNGDTITLSNISQGRSNYKGSTYNRMANVKKAINQHINNVIVEPGAEFSFNETLNGRVTTGNGWSMAKVILNGDQLVLQPGGGICQASTTVYRAIVNSGFPVTARRSHSLYVYYYKQYGVGIDATIYPGTQDLAFVNESSHPIIIQSYTTDDKDVVVNFYGVPDGRSVALEGPYFYSNTPKDLEEKWRKVKKNEILWVQNIKLPNGQIKENFIVSKYKTLPSSLPSEFIVRNEEIEPLASNM